MDGKSVQSPRAHAETCTSSKSMASMVSKRRQYGRCSQPSFQQFRRSTRQPILLDCSASFQGTFSFFETTTAADRDAKHLQRARNALQSLPVTRRAAVTASTGERCVHR
jgi:hypothetical protein